MASSSKILIARWSDTNGEKERRDYGILPQQSELGPAKWART